MAFNRINSKKDICENNTLTNCLKNLKFKIKNNYNLSEENLSRLSAADIFEAQIDKCNLMQWAIMKNNAHNVRMLFKFFELKTYVSTLNTASIDIQNNIKPLLITLLEEAKLRHEKALNHFNSFNR